MWLLTPFGFFSVVDKHDPQHPDALCIRARFDGDLENLRERIPALGPTITGAGTDYRYRAWCDREALAAGMADIARGIDYNNFKNRVKKVQGYDRASVYGRIWSVLFDAARAARRRDRRDAPRW